MHNIVRSPGKYYSPLRYPGGKSCLAYYISNLIELNKIGECTYVEPYAGGAGAALTMLILEKVDRIIINDLDKSVYSFWKAITTQTDRFVEKIRRINVNIHEWHFQKEVYHDKNSKQFDLGFAAFFLNRTNRSGIIEGGPIGGIQQKSAWPINARFNKTELISRIEKIASYGSRINVTNQDGIELLKSVKNNKKYFVYLDPPYYVKGSCLYLNHYNFSDHKELANFLNSHNDFYWALSYDNIEEIKKMYSKRNHFGFSIKYHIDTPKQGEELMVLSDIVRFN